MSRGRSLRRPVQPRRVGRKVLIACEGEATEPLYFNALRISLRLQTVQVRVVRHGGTDPRSIVRAALSARREEQREPGGWEPGDQAWAVFDGDEHRDRDRHNWNDALQIAEANSIRLAISNPSFELWYLLHFQDQFGHLTRHVATRLLVGHVPEYEKSTCLYPHPLKDATEQALERVRLLGERAAANTPDPHPNPSTGVAELVKLLLELRG